MIEEMRPAALRAAVSALGRDMVQKSDETQEKLDKPLCFYLSKLSTEELLKMLYKVY